MNVRYLFPFAIFLASLTSSAQKTPGEYRVLVSRLAESTFSVQAQSYSMRSRETAIDFAGTALMPKAHGTAKVQVVRGGLQVNAHLEGIGPASQLDPAFLTYVLWAIPANHGTAQNLGELVLKGGEGTITGFTKLTAFALIVTAEPYFAVEQPSQFIVMQNILPKPTENPNILRADLLPLHRDSKTPLDIYEARNAVRIARLAGAERYAAEPFHKALQLLQQAESIFAHRSGGDIPDVKEKAREATEAAEEARATAVQKARATAAEHGVQSNFLPPPSAP